MENNELTSHSFWKAYWESKQNLIFEIKKNYELGGLVADVIKDKNIKTAIELGGFPGYYAILLKKHHQIAATLLDYFVHDEIIKNLIKANGLNSNDIAIIQTDLFNYTPDKKYDLVLSCGLIEHFEDVKDIIARHVQFLNPNGTLLITLPNFTGVNGWVQKTFDKANYDKHNISTMNPALLAGIAKDLGLKEVSCNYYGKFSVWLENKKEKPTLTKAFVKTIWIAGKVITKTFGFDSKLLSPYIVLVGKR